MIVHTCATAIESVSIGGQLLYLSWIGFLFFILHKVAARSFPALCHLFISFCILVGSFDFPVSFFFFFSFLALRALPLPDLPSTSSFCLIYIITTQPTPACFQLRLPGSNDPSLFFYVNVLLLTGKVV